MRLRLLLLILAGLLFDARITAQTNSGWIPTPPVGTATSPAPAFASAPIPQPVATPVTTSGSGDSAEMTSADFEIDGVPYAKVLYLEGNVWIRPPGDTGFHRLEADEPIANQSVIYTGYNGTLDFATGPGMATRMVPKTALVVNALPAPAPASSTAPAVSQIDLRRGTIFSALGRENGAPIDYSVQTPSGVAGARGTMFATSVVTGTTQVSMLHGTVNFETPDHQTSQITAGQSQQITGGAGGKYQFSRQKPLSPANSETFFNHAGGLLEHASGYGVVRRGLGADVAREMQRHGYRLPAGTTERLQNAGKTHYQNKPVYNRAKTPQVKSTNYHTPNTKSSIGTGYHPATQNQKPPPRRYPEDETWRDKDKNLGQ
ncbi:MAG: FecR domain-containing protein [Methylacidiphilales bacterium]|nr:FecR domain-containing protein [Candidatus Methylacidiphilales bacterium]